MIVENEAQLISMTELHCDEILGLGERESDVVLVLFVLQITFHIGSFGAFMVEPSPLEEGSVTLTLREKKSRPCKTMTIYASGPT